MKKKKFETLTDFYKGFMAFRVCVKSLHKAHNAFLHDMSSDLYAERNDESVEFCRGVVFTAYCLEYIDSYAYGRFCDVLRRYKSFNVKYK